VYVPDEDDVKDTVSPAAVAKLAIIRIIGVRAGWMFFVLHTNFSLLILDLLVIIDLFN